MKRNVFLICLFLSCSLALNAAPVRVPDSDDIIYEDFFEENYRSIWDELPELEQYAIAFSSNLFELNRQYHLDFTGRTVLGNDSSDPAELLKDSWGITDGQGLLDSFNSLENYGHSGAYKSLSDLLDKYPDKNPFEIAVAEHLSILDITRLLFVRDTRQALGIHGIEAWDEGREITIMRWGIASGYITEEEAKGLIAPVVERIRQNYINWNDYINHYIQGRRFYGLYDWTLEKLEMWASVAAYSACAYIPLNSLEFSGENADTVHEMSSYYRSLPLSNELLDWAEVQKLSNQNVTKSNFEQLKKIEQNYSDYSDMFFWMHVVMLRNFGSDSEMVQYVEQHMDYFNSMNKEEFEYSNSLYYYISALNYTYHPEKALDVYASQSTSIQMNIHFYYQYAYSNYLMLNFCQTQAEFEAYKSRAINAFRLLKQYDYDLGTGIEGWLESVI